MEPIKLEVQADLEPARAAHAAFLLDQARAHRLLAAAYREAAQALHSKGEGDTSTTTKCRALSPGHNHPLCDQPLGHLGDHMGGENNRRRRWTVLGEWVR